MKLKKNVTQDVLLDWKCTCPEILTLRWSTTMKRRKYPSTKVINQSSIICRMTLLTYKYLYNVPAEFFIYRKCWYSKWLFCLLSFGIFCIRLPVCKLAHMLASLASMPTVMSASKLLLPSSRVHDFTHCHHELTSSSWDTSCCFLGRSV